MASTELVAKEVFAAWSTASGTLTAPNVLVFGGAVVLCTPKHSIADHAVAEEQSEQQSGKNVSYQIKMFGRFGREARMQKNLFDLAHDDLITNQTPRTTTVSDYCQEKHSSQPRQKLLSCNSPKASPRPKWECGCVPSGSTSRCHVIKEECQTRLVERGETGSEEGSNLIGRGWA